MRALILMLLYSAAAAAFADTSGGSVEVHGWDPKLQVASGSAVQPGGYDPMSLGPLAATSAGHPFDPPQTSGAAASLVFDRPAAGDAIYHSFAGGWAFSYTPEPYAKSGRTTMTLTGYTRLQPDDVSRLFGLLPDDATISFESHLFLEGSFIAETAAGGLPVNTADAGVRFMRTLNGNAIGGSLLLHGENGADPTISAGGVLAGKADAHVFSGFELAAMFPGANLAWGTGQARGATLLSDTDIVEGVTFSGHCLRILFGCAAPPDYYEAALSFTIETWGDVGFSQGSTAAVDMRDTLDLSLTVLDANGQPTDIPVYFAIAEVPEPRPAWAWLAALPWLAWRLRARVGR